VRPRLSAGTTCCSRGPGRARLLFQRQIPFRVRLGQGHHPGVDYLRARPDVDRSRIALVRFESRRPSSSSAPPRTSTGWQPLSADPGFLSVWLPCPRSSCRSPAVPQWGRQEINTVWQDKVIPVLAATDRYELARCPRIWPAVFAGRARRGSLYRYVRPRHHSAEVSVASVADRVKRPHPRHGLRNRTRWSFPFPSRAPRSSKLLRGPKQQHTSPPPKAPNSTVRHAPQVRNQVVYDWLDRAS